MLRRLTLVCLLLAPTARATTFPSYLEGEYGISVTYFNPAHVPQPVTATAGFPWGNALWPAVHGTGHFDDVAMTWTLDSLSAGPPPIDFGPMGIGGPSGPLYLFTWAWADDFALEPLNTVVAIDPVTLRSTEPIRFAAVELGTFTVAFPEGPDTVAPLVVGFELSIDCGAQWPAGCAGGTGALAPLAVTANGYPFTVLPTAVVGLDWTPQTPEPGAGVLLLVAAGALMRRRRAR